MTIKIQGAKRPVADADLALFGIESKTPPSLTKFPAAFNSKAHKLWRSVLESTAYAKLLVKEPTPTSSELWSFAIQAFLKACAAANVYAFEGKHNYETVARDFLTSARKRLASYLAGSGIFEVLKIKKVTRSYTFTAQNFLIEVKAELRPIQDPSFSKWLTTLPSPGFTKHLDGILRKSVHAHIDVEFATNRQGMSTLTYRIFCHTPARLIADLPNRKKLETFVEKKLWVPICREHPIQSLSNRTF